MLRRDQRLCRRQGQRWWSSSSKLMDVPSKSVYGLKITTKHHSYKASPITQTFRMQWRTHLHLSYHKDSGFSLLFQTHSNFSYISCLEGWNFLFSGNGACVLCFTAGQGDRTKRLYCHYAEYRKLLRTTLDQCDKIQRNETKQLQQNIFQNNTQIKTMSFLP